MPTSDIPSRAPCAADRRNTWEKLRYLFHCSHEPDEIFPLLKLPTELRIMAYKRILSIEPPRLDGRAILSHPLFHENDVIFNDAPGTFYHSVPIVVQPNVNPQWLRRIGKNSFLGAHDNIFGRSQRHRIRLHIAQQQYPSRCHHVRCIFRPFRCEDVWTATPLQSLALWRRFSRKTGIPLANFSVYDPHLRGPFVDEARLADICSAAFSLCFFPIGLIWIGCMLLYEACVETIDVLEEYSLYVERQKRLYGWWAAVKQYLRCATVLFIPLYVGLLFLIDLKYYDSMDVETRQEVVDAVLIQWVTAVGVGAVVWS